jgi:hypothetical protein
MDSASTLIQEYLAAFKDANTMAEIPDVSYSKGFYVVKTSRGYPVRYRRRKLEQMRDELRRRANIIAS